MTVTALRALYPGKKLQSEEGGQACGYLCHHTENLQQEDHELEVSLGLLVRPSERKRWVLWDGIHVELRCSCTYLQPSTGLARVVDPEAC